MNNKSRITVLLQAIIIAGISIFTLKLAYAQEIVEDAIKTQASLRRFVPTTVSEGWQDVYEKLPDPTQMATLPAPDDIEAWGKVHSNIE